MPDEPGQFRRTLLNRAGEVIGISTPSSLTREYQLRDSYESRQGVLPSLLAMAVSFALDRFPRALTMECC